MHWHGHLEISGNNRIKQKDSPRTTDGFFKGTPLWRHRDIIFRTSDRRNSKTLYVIPIFRSWKQMLTQAKFKRTFAPPIIKAVSQVKQMKGTPKPKWRKGNSGISRLEYEKIRSLAAEWNLALKVSANQIPCGTVVPSFLIATNKRHIGLGTSTFRNRHNPTSAMQSSLDHGTSTGSSSDFTRIANCQLDPTSVHSCKTSKVPIIDLLLSEVGGHGERWRITKFGTASTRSPGRRNSITRQSRRQERKRKVQEMMGMKLKMN